jgi:hypothetical protein
MLSPQHMHDQMAHMHQQMTRLQSIVEQQQQQLHVQAQQAASSSSASAPVVRALELPKIRQPSLFTGTMGFAVDDWISEMQQQFDYYDKRFPDDATRILFAVAHFGGAATHWWEHQTAKPTTWADFVARLHGRFRPVHAAMLARQKLGKLRQRAGQSVNQYVGIFQNTLTPISDMGATDQVHHFVNGLLAPVAAKVWEKHPKDLIEAIDAAVSVEAMHNFGRAALPYQHRSGHGGSSSSGATSNPDAMDLNNLEAEAGEVVNDHTSTTGAAHNGHLAMMAKMVDQMSAMEMRINALAGRAPSGKPQGRNTRREYIDGLDAATIKNLQAEGKCFRCKKEGHMKNECPMKPKNA